MTAFAIEPPVRTKMFPVSSFVSTEEEDEDDVEDEDSTTRTFAIFVALKEVLEVLEELVHPTRVLAEEELTELAASWSS